MFDLKLYAISIHSPHARGDTMCFINLPCLIYFNPLPSCEGRRKWCRREWPPEQFQSTPLMRGETTLTLALIYLMLFQSTPLMRGETHMASESVQDVRISIHSPHARGDATAGEGKQQTKLFQSTPLMRGETRLAIQSVSKSPFQSTPLMRGETMFRYAPRGQSNHFNPLPSCEGRQDQSLQARVAEDFNPLPSCEGRLSFADALLVFLYFNPLPSCEGRRFCLPAFPVANNFNPLPSCEGRPNVP